MARRDHDEDRDDEQGKEIEDTLDHDGGQQRGQRQV